MTTTGMKQVLCCILFFLAVRATAQEYSLFLLGDAGEAYVQRSAIGEVLREKIKAAGEERSMVIFLGDNIYPEGLPESTSGGFAKAEGILNVLTGWTSGLKSKTVFIPGNHDWQHWGKNGLQYALNQQRWIDSLKDDRIHVQPPNGCPGPEEIELPGNAVLIVLNTQWFLHGWERTEPTSQCLAKSEAEVFAQLENVLARNAGKQIIVAGHHPVITYGVHGGVYTWKDHLFPLTHVEPYLYLPLPIVGSLYPLYRKKNPHIQDTGHPEYKKFASRLHNLLARYPGSIYAAGHEHSLQYNVKDSVHYIVSGAAAKAESVKRKKFSAFAKETCGFVELSLGPGTRIIRYWRVDRRFPKGTEIFTVKE